MHLSVIDFVVRMLPPVVLAGKSVLEVGSYDVNGSVRPYVQPHCATYLGIDMRNGPGVDKVCNVSSLVSSFGKGFVDILITAEMLEHVEDWRAAVFNMKAALKPGGILILTTRSYGFPLHEYPGDYWRFEVNDMLKIFADFAYVWVEPDPLVPGVFVFAKKPESPVQLSGIDVYRMPDPAA